MSVEILVKAAVRFLRRILEVIGFRTTFSESFLDDLF